MEEGKVFDGGDSETIELIFSKLIPVSRTLERVLIEAFNLLRIPDLKSGKRKLI